MCGEKFWKRVIAFCLTFGLSIFVADFFADRESPAESLKTVSAPALDLKNCVSADKGSKYENLPLKKSPEFETQPDNLKPPDKRLNKEKQPEPESQFYVPERDLTEYQTLLHKEKCQVTDGRK